MLNSCNYSEQIRIHLQYSVKGINYVYDFYQNTKGT